jgi:GNAT superfamily N-acetyltransferase
LTALVEIGKRWPATWIFSLKTRSALTPMSVPGDAAAIVIEDYWPVGAAWYRLFTRDEPGYGFVDEQTPEISIAVVPNKRGGGHGSQLLEALIQRARDDGYKALSLSVEPDNPALKLYERLGFRKVGETGGSWTMKVDLDPATRIDGEQAEGARDGM